MLLSESVKPVTWVKANAAQMLKDIEDTGKSIVITKNGEAKAIVMDIREHEKNQDTMAMLRMLADSSAALKAGQHRTPAEVFSSARNVIQEIRARKAAEARII
ncbi:MAG: type II toxin-antitoxin system Phd/YefM family antitoxin [Deltaproteobacteria bacterium]|nr:type II toxin-antitoxin system Phd/YefM family antitoxin [Deltaproteobacteria bacterium]